MKIVKYLSVMMFALLYGCNKEDGLRNVPDLKTLYENLKFDCVHESDRLPPLMLEPDELYKYGLFLQYKAGPKDFNEVARYYRISAAHGHYKASTNLQALVSQGAAQSPDSWVETIDLVEAQIKQGVPGAYYDMAHYLELGFGVVQDREKARVYYRHSADMGSPDAQYHVAELLGRVYGPEEPMLQMYQCAMEQGHSKGGFSLAMYRKEGAEYTGALHAFQKAVESGHVLAALFLKAGFLTSDPKNELDYLALTPDSERSRRYGLIEIFLSRYENLGAKVPDIDQIVPLPPAKLPDWDETFQWKKDRDAAVPPVKPSDELMQRLSEEKGLDPVTGLALPSK